MCSARTTSPPQGSAGQLEGKSSRPTVVLVGFPEHFHHTFAYLTKLKGMVGIEFHDLSAELLEKIAPDVVISPLLCAGFDCLDLAKRLADLGSKARYVAIAGDLPNLALVRDEVRSHCPGIDFDIQILRSDPDQPLH